MSLADYFEKFCEEELPITDDEFQKWDSRLKEITKKLNLKYYPDDDFKDVEKDHLYIVGSVGRKTAIKNTSDFDILFQLPQEVYNQYNNYSGNGQSALLQEMKNIIKERYSTTDIRGDGQVVVIEFKSNPAGVIELVPAFEQIDGSFKYPDSHNGGSWKTTNPTPEINECNNLSGKTDGHFINLCRLLRKWKNTEGFAFKGLLIDALVSNYFESRGSYSMSYRDYERDVVDLFGYLAEQDKNRKYWYALGSNQQISNNDNGRFIAKAKKAYKALFETEDIVEEFKKLFGSSFAKTTASFISNRAAPGEQFIEDMFPINIRFNLELDCKITQDGWRPQLLRDFLKNKIKLKDKKSLDFYIAKSEIPTYLEPNVEYYWKVRNVGSEAVRRNCERGQIYKGTNRKRETADFRGSHFVECYAVHSGVVIAKAKIDVPIDPIAGKDLVF